MHEVWVGVIYNDLLLFNDSWPAGNAGIRWNWVIAALGTAAQIKGQTMKQHKKRTKNKKKRWLDNLLNIDQWLFLVPLKGGR